MITVDNCWTYLDEVADNLDEAFNLAKLMMKNQHESQDFLIILTGSLYFAGQFLQKN